MYHQLNIKMQCKLNENAMQILSEDNKEDKKWK